MSKQILEPKISTSMSEGGEGSLGSKIIFYASNLVRLLFRRKELYGINEQRALFLNYVEYDVYSIENLAQIIKNQFIKLEQCEFQFTVEFMTESSCWGYRLEFIDPHHNSTFMVHAVQSSIKPLRNLKDVLEVYKNLLKNLSVVEQLSPEVRNLLPKINNNIAKLELEIAQCSTIHEITI